MSTSTKMGLPLVPTGLCFCFIDQSTNPCSVTPSLMNLLSFCALVLLLGLSIGMFFRLFRRVYGAGGDTVQVGFYTWVDLVLASFVVILIVSQILAAAGGPQQVVPENIDTRTMVLSVLTWWGLILGPILISLRFRGLKLGSVFGVDRMPVGRSLLLGI